MSGGNGADCGTEGADGVRGGEASLWLPSRRLTRSLVAIEVGGRMSFYGCHLG